MTAETVARTLPIVEMTRENDDFRRVVRTGLETQVVLMSVPPGESIGLEAHHHTDQVLIVVEGEGRAEIGDEVSDMAPGHLAFVPAGMKHDFTSTGDRSLKLFTTYSPPEHAMGAVHETRAEADAAEGH